MGGSLTYHQPDMGLKILNYGFNVDFLSNQYGDFFIWRSPTEVYKPSPFTNMGREENNFHIDPFINYVNPENGTSHKIKGRFYYSADNIVRPTEGSSITDILGNMGTDANTIKNIVNGDYSSLYPALVGIGSGIINGNLDDAMNGAFTSLGNIFPNATTADYCCLILAEYRTDNCQAISYRGCLMLSIRLDSTRKLKQTRTLTIISTISSTRNGTVAHRSLRE